MTAVEGGELNEIPQGLAAEVLAGDFARGGRLSEAGRKAAVASALPLVGRYFASGELPLVAQKALNQGPDSEDDVEMSTLLAALRLRVAIAAAMRLRGILTRIVSRSTFRYQVTSVDSVGFVNGHLDTNRYATSMGTHDDVVTYPVLQVRRAGHTPENVLATYLAVWLLRELRNAYIGSRAPTGSPEYDAYRVELRELQKVLRLPAMTACLEQAERINRRCTERQLVAAVIRRLRRREIANATPYSELVEWVGRVLDGKPAAEAGDLEWAFYGDRFDTKLFELWCLQFVSSELSRHLFTAIPALHLKWRAGEPAYTWNLVAGSISLYFQKSVGSISDVHAPRWYEEQGGALRGVPDIVLKAVPRDVPHTSKFAVLDPKLRQREGVPSDELYKILGYIDNFGLSDDPFGAILYYGSGSSALASYRYRPAEGPGALFAVRLDPARLQESRAQIAGLIVEILGMLKIPSLLASEDAVEVAEDAVDPESRYRAKKAQLDSYMAGVPAGILNVSRQRMLVLLGSERWEALTSSVQTMLATAEHLGFTLLAESNPLQVGDVDFSGPVIGICASIESILHQAIITPAAAHNPTLGAKLERMTLGAVVALIEQAVQGSANLGPGHVAVKNHILQTGFDTVRLAGLIPGLRHVNQTWRTQAAHRSVVPGGEWTTLWHFVVTSGLLSDVVDVLLQLPQEV